MKLYLITLFIFLTSFWVDAKYVPMKIYEMIIGADKIVYGEVIEIDSLTYTLRIEKNLTGTETTLKILKFKDWPCAWRWTNYQVGQKLFLFLQEHKGKLYSMSAGNEGELPLDDSSVFVNGLSLNSLPAIFSDSIVQLYSSQRGTLISRNYHIYGSDYFGYKVSIPDFLSTISTLRNCFKISYGQYLRIEKVTITCDIEELESKAQIEKILRWSFEELKEKATENTK